MELPSKLLAKLVRNTRPKIEELLLIVMDKTAQVEHLSQTLQTNNKLFKIAVTFLRGYNGIFIITNSNNKFIFKKTIANEEDIIQNTIPLCACEIENLDAEIKRLIINKWHYTEENYRFTVGPNFSTLGSIIQKLPQGPIFGFVFDDSIGNLLGFNETNLYKEYNLSGNLVDILSSDNFFKHRDIAQGIIFNGKRSGIIHNFTMDVKPGYKYIENFRGGVQCYMMDSKDNISSVCFK